MAISALLVFAVIGSGAAFAQTTAPAPAQAQPAPSATPGSSDKKAISKSCTDQANAKGLHGKARKKFRSDCKHAGGKPQ
jgi:psiF repeat